MPDKPILIFPAATVAARQSAGGGGADKMNPPTKASQRRRLKSQWDELITAFPEVKATSDDVDPQQVVVLQVAGSIEGFQKAVRGIAGMEWLGDFEADIEEPAPGFLLDGKQPSALAGRIFVVASNQAQAKQLVSIWNIWLNVGADRMSRKLAAYARVFKSLHAVRLWGPEDRVHATGVVEQWKKGLYTNDPVVRFEAELWYREKPGVRDTKFNTLQAQVKEAGGRCIARRTIEEIEYDGVLIELPAAAVHAVVSELNQKQGKTILWYAGVRQFSPPGQASVQPIGDGTVVLPPERPMPTGEPVVALLDGVPLTNHAALQGRLVVDDADLLEARYQAGEHRHGTAMASLIAHGEYNGAGPALTSKIYVRPVMHPYGPSGSGRRQERFPADTLTVDLIHRAVRRMFDGEPGQPPAAPTVKAINLSLGDETRLFDRDISPWARLLDWLSVTYNVLFIVSSGNPGKQVTIPTPPASIAQMSDVELRSETLKSMAEKAGYRRLLAPAESVNALTVGSLHAQEMPHGDARFHIDPLRGAELPSPSNPVASGFRRAVKPEILVPGGRLHLERPINQPDPAKTLFTVSEAPAQPGQLVAACDPAGNSNSKAIRLCGSSNAAALTTRRAAQMIERLRELQAEPGGAALTDAHMAVILKAMLVHGASWGRFEEFFYAKFVPPEDGKKDWQKVKRDCAQFIGYGLADFDRGTVCTDQRVIVLGCGALNAEEGHRYNVPLPPALHAVKVKRRLTVTLAWLTPINPRHRAYRVADLWFKVPVPTDTDRKKGQVFPSFLHSIEQRDVDEDTSTRGTVQHEVIEGEDIVAITDGDTMPVQINCRPEAASKINAPVPYALLVSLETAQPLAVSIYAQVKAKIDTLHVQVPVGAATAPRSRPR